MTKEEIMRRYESLDFSSLTDADVSAGVRFDQPKSQFASGGMVSPLTGDQPINSTTTVNLSTQNYRLGKFMREFSQTSFEDLQEVTQPNGSVIWAMDTAIDNQDFNFYVSQLDLLQSVTLTEVQSEAQIEALAREYDISTSQTYIVIDGTKYFVHMDSPMYFSTGETNDSLLSVGLFVLGDGAMATAIAAVVASLGMDAFQDALKNLASAVFKTLWALVKGAMTAIYRFVTGFFGALVDGESLEVAVAAGRTAAGDAWEESVETITAQTVRYAFAGAIVLVTIFLILEYVLHYSYQNIYLYNLTDYDLQFDFPYTDFGDPSNVLTTCLEARSARLGPGGVVLGSWYNGVAFRFNSGSEFHGLGYTMRLKLVDPQTQAVVKTFSCLFDVPFSGDNSLFASAGEESDYESYYSDNEGQHKVTQYVASDGEHQMIVTYDYLSGKHTDPQSGKDLYLYNSLVVIREGAGGSVTSSPGDVQVFCSNADDDLVSVVRNSSGSWTGVQSFGFPVSGTPTAAMIPGSDTLQLFYCGGGGELKSVWRTDNGTWSGEQSLGVAAAGRPFAATVPDTGVLQLFYRSPGGVLKSVWRGENGDWSGEQDLGVSLVGDPVAVPVPLTEVLQVFYQSPDGVLKTIWRNEDGDWSGEQDLGVSLSGSPTAAIIPEYNLQLFYRSSDGVLKSVWRNPDGSWSDQQDLGVTLTSDPVVALVPGTDVYQVFYCGEGGVLKSIWRDGDGIWSGEQDLKVQLTGSPATVVIPGTDVLQLFYRGSGGVLKSIWRDDNGHWSGEQDLGVPVVGVPCAYAGPG